jgi:hypothetical protein
MQDGNPGTAEQRHLLFPAFLQSISYFNDGACPGNAAYNRARSASNCYRLALCCMGKRFAFRAHTEPSSAGDKLHSLILYYGCLGAKHILA